MIEEKEVKLIKDVLNRLISEECVKLNKCSGRIGNLSHQLRHYTEMDEEIRTEVNNEIFNLMHENGWSKWAKEVEEELGEKK